MSEPFIGSEAVAGGAIGKSALRRKYTRVFRDVYIAAGIEPTAHMLARAGWLWSGRKAVVAGRSAAAILGARWIDAQSPVDLIHDNRNRVAGINVRGDRVAGDEFLLVDGMAVTTPERTALDLACWYPGGTALAALDALARAAQLDAGILDGLVQRYPGRRGIRQARKTLPLVDSGAQSPRESWLRHMLVKAGLPCPKTQITVADDFGNTLAILDMGWEELKVAVEYDGEQHRAERRQYVWDIRRMELLEQRGWIIIRVTVGDQRADILQRVRGAIARRTSNQRDVRRSA